LNLAQRLDNLSADPWADITRIKQQLPPSSGKR
jgi:hypothetical protein